MAQEVQRTSATGAEARPGVTGARAPAVRKPNILSRIWRFNRRWPVLPLTVLSLLIFCAIFANVIAPAPPDNTASRLAFSGHPPTWFRADEHTGPEPKREDFPDTTAGTSAYNRAKQSWHPQSWYSIGADQQGRDLLSRVIHGSRISLQVAALGLVVGTFVGTTLGVLSGYYVGNIDEVISRIVDVWRALPFILLALAVSVVFGSSLFIVMLLISLLAWPAFVRQVRADALTVRTRDYVLAAKIAGASDLRILVKHVLPGTYSTVLVVASLNVGTLILAESILSFLGVGIPDPIPAWGKSVADGRRWMETAPWITVAPGAAIFLTVMSFNFLGDWLRDRLDPRLRQLD